MASYGLPGFDLGTLTASGDMDANQYLFVRPAVTEGAFLVANGASGPAPFGVLQDDPRDGQAGKIRVVGVTQLWLDAGTAIGYGDFITSGSDGWGVTAATAGSNPYHAMSLTTVATGCVLGTVLLMSGQVNADNTP